MRNKINRAECEISQAVEMAQMLMLDRAAQRGFTRKFLYHATGIPLSTLKSYEEGTAMPLSAFVKIAGVKGFPNELLSLVIDPADKSVHDSEEDETDFDDLARAASDYLVCYSQARHPDSPGSIRIVHNEKPELKLKAQGLKAAAKKVA